MPVDWFCSVLWELSGTGTNRIINIGSGFPLPVADILRIKKLPYNYHEERYCDDRRISFDALRNATSYRLDYHELLSALNAYILNNR